MHNVEPHSLASHNISMIDKINYYVWIPTDSISQYSKLIGNQRHLAVGLRVFIPMRVLNYFGHRLVRLTHLFDVDNEWDVEYS